MGGVEPGPSKWRCPGSGWEDDPGHRGARCGGVPEEDSGRPEGGKVLADPCPSPLHSEAGWEEKAVGDPDGERPGGASGGQDRDRADLRGGFRGVQLRIPSWRNAQQALEAIRETANAGYNWVVDADIEKYFDSIDHELLMEAVQKRISDRKMLKLIRKWLKAGVMEEGALRATEVGSPQGSVISPLLSNIYLGELDRRWRSLQRDHQADTLCGRLGGDVSHPEGSPTGTPDGGSDPQRAQAQATPREDADRQSQRRSGGVHVSGMHAQEGAVAEERTNVLSEPLAEPEEHGAHPGTYSGDLRSPAPWTDGLAGSDRKAASGDARMGRLLPKWQCLESLHEDRTPRPTSVEPSPSPPQSESTRVSDLSGSLSPWTAPSARHDSISRRYACTDRIDSR